MPVMGMIPMVMPTFWKTLKAMKAKSPVQTSRPNDVPGAPGRPAGSARR